MPMKVNSKEFRITGTGQEIIVIGDFTEREIALIDCIALLRGYPCRNNNISDGTITYNKVVE